MAENPVTLHDVFPITSEYSGAAERDTEEALNHTREIVDQFRRDHGHELEQEPDRKPDRP